MVARIRGIDGRATVDGGDTQVATPLTTEAIRDRLAAMTVEQKCKLLVMNYGDTRVPAWSGSVIVNQTHLTASGVAQLKAMNTKAASNTGVTPLVAADQEGGLVNRMRSVPGVQGMKFPGPRDMQRFTPEQLRDEGAKVGKALRVAGVNMLLGPVLDPASPGSLMDKQGRAFGSNPSDVLARAQPYIDGLRSENRNVVIIAKHFPGYDVKGNSDIWRVDDPSTAAQVEQKANAFFSANGIDGVMVSSIRYPNIDDQPACFSPAIIAMLRKRLPNALVITDDVAAGGLLSEESASYKMYTIVAGQSGAAAKADVERILKKYPAFATAAGAVAIKKKIHDEIRENAKKAFLAGCDVVLTMDSAEAPAISAALTELVQSRPDLAARLDQAAARVLRSSIKAGAAPAVS